MWKKLFLTILCLMLVIMGLICCLAACGGDGQPADTTVPTGQADTSGALATEATPGASQITDPTTDVSVVPTDTSEPPTESPTEALTDVPTETLTGISTDVPTEPVTIPETEPETLTPEEKQAIINEILANTHDTLLPIGGWATPASALRDGYTGVEGSYDTVFQAIADAGINYMITLEEWSSGSWPLESLSSAKKAGIKLWYNCAGQGYDWNMEKINALLTSENADALAGIYVKDEPTLGDIEALASLTMQMREALGEDFTLPVFSNLLPTYATTGMVGADYRSYVQTYVDQVKPDILMFDYYPYPVSGDSLPSMIANIAIAKQMADAEGIPLYTYIQSSSNATMREPSLEELRANVNINLALGVKGYAYFLICEHYEGWDFSGMIDYSGDKTAMYDKIKTVNEEVLAMRGVFLGYECKAVMSKGYLSMNSALLSEGCKDLLVNEYGHLTNVKSNAGRCALVGCFENANAEVAYYVVNANYAKADTITLTFDEPVSYRIWGSGGLEDIGTTSTLTLPLEAGEGVFIEIE